MKHKPVLRYVRGPDQTDGMKTHLLNLGRQVEEALAIGRAFSWPVSPRKISKILFCGMGGSGVSGAILRALVAQPARLPFVLHRGNGPFPKWVDSKTLVILSSYSGNTGEILSAFRALQKKKGAGLDSHFRRAAWGIGLGKKMAMPEDPGGTSAALRHRVFNLFPPAFFPPVRVGRSFPSRTPRSAFRDLPHLPIDGQGPGASAFRPLHPSLWDLRIRGTCSGALARPACGKR